jgi:hypothetical protein
MGMNSELVSFGASLLTAGIAAVEAWTALLLSLLREVLHGA